MLAEVAKTFGQGSCSRSRSRQTLDFARYIQSQATSATKYPRQL